MLEKIIGKKSFDVTPEELVKIAAEYKSVHIDLGTGDGLFAWRKAKDEPETLVLGLDAARESLAEGSARAAKKPARGGAKNALFFCMNVLDMPDSFNGMADSISINFPWGSLLQAVTIPWQENLEAFAALVKTGGVADVHINMYVFGKEEERIKLGLPELDEDFLQNTLFPAFEKAGLKVLKHIFIAGGQKVDVASTWGGRLTRNSGRPTLSFVCEKV